MMQEFSSIVMLITALTNSFVGYAVYRLSVKKHQMDMQSKTKSSTDNTAEEMTIIKSQFVLIGGICMIASLSFSAILIFSHTADMSPTIGGITTIALIFYLALLSLTCFIIGTKSI